MNKMFQTLGGVAVVAASLALASPAFAKEMAKQEPAAVQQKAEQKAEKPHGKHHHHRKHVKGTHHASYNPGFTKFRDMHAKLHADHKQLEVAKAQLKVVQTQEARDNYEAARAQLHNDMQQMRGMRQGMVMKRGQWRERHAQNEHVVLNETVSGRIAR